MLTGAFILPHPPIIIPKIGKGEEKGAKDTIRGVMEIAEIISIQKPEVIIVITPHGPVFGDAVCISMEDKLYGDFKNFGYSDIKFKFDNDFMLAQRIAASANLEDIMVAELDKEFAKRYNISDEIDHGTLVPLYFVNQKYTDYRLIHITMGMLSYQDLYKFGMSISSVISEDSRKVAVIASGDLSHSLLPSSPAGFNLKGKEFDQKVVSLIKEHSIKDLLDIDDSLVENAAECGLRPIIILQGILDKYTASPAVLSYEGPFGVGYMTARYEISGIKDDSLYENIIKENKDKIQKIRTEEDEYVKLARMSLEEYVRNNRIIKVPENINDELKNQSAGVFVSIKKHGQLRGCIGTIAPTKENIALEIIYNAISSGTKDNRFSPVEEYELEELIYSVDVLKEPEEIKSKDELDVKRYGVIVSKGYKRGLLLPNLDGVDTIEQQISIALSKAGIKEDGYSIERFEVIRHGSK